MRLLRPYRFLIALAAMSLACGVSGAQDAPSESKKQPEIYSIRVSGERGNGTPATAAEPGASQPASPSQLPASPSPPIAASNRLQPVTAAQIAAWIRELDSVEFDTRETAMYRLIDAGPAVLPVLRPAFAKGSLETMTRALYVARQLGVAANLDVQDEAGQLLRDLTEQTDRPVLARRAEATLAELTHQRSQQAIAALKELGAIVTAKHHDLNNPFDQFLDSLEIGEAFKGTEDDLRRLKWIADLPILIFNGRQVTDDWIRRAAAMPALEELHVYRAKLSDQALVPLINHHALKELGIYYTPLHDAALEPLTKLPILSFVKLYGTQVTIPGAEKFKAAAGIAVDFRRGAFMGVGAYENEGKCQIRTVHPDSPAQKAGIQVHDIIIRFGGAEVTSFGHLTDLIAPHEVGDVVEIELLRPILSDQTPLQAMTTKVTLAGWEADKAVQNQRR